MEHYLKLSVPEANLSPISTRVLGLLDQYPRFAGVKLPRQWGHDNPKRGVYDLGPVLDFADHLQRQGKKLWFVSEYKAFDDRDINCLSPIEFQPRVFAHKPGASSAPMQDTDCRSAYLDYLSVFRRNVGQHPAFECIETSESA